VPDGRRKRALYVPSFHRKKYRHVFTVELHGGAIWAENRSSGKGSAFYVRLPIDGAAALS
jgi:hypothetical protein